MNKSSVATCVLSNCSAISAIVTLVSLISPVWITAKFDGVDVYAGLFEKCQSGYCHHYPESLVAVYIKVTQAFLILAISLLVINSVYCIIVALKNVHSIIIVVFFAASAICTFIAMTVFTEKQSIQEGATYGYSFVIGWVAFGLDMIFIPVSFFLIKATSQSISGYSAMD